MIIEAEMILRMAIIASEIVLKVCFVSMIIQILVSFG